MNVIEVRCFVDVCIVGGGRVVAGGFGGGAESGERVGCKTIVSSGGACS